MTWLGPVVPLIHLCHPDIIRSVVSASGTHGSWWRCGCGDPRASHALRADPGAASSSLLLPLSAFPPFHVLATPTPVPSPPLPPFLPPRLVLAFLVPSGILGDPKPDSVPGELNLEETGPDKDTPTTCGQEWSSGGWVTAEWRREISARAGREASWRRRHDRTRVDQRPDQ